MGGSRSRPAYLAPQLVVMQVQLLQASSPHEAAALKNSHHRRCRLDRESSRTSEGSILENSGVAKCWLLDRLGFQRNLGPRLHG